MTSSLCNMNVHCRGRLQQQQAARPWYTGAKVITPFVMLSEAKHLLFWQTDPSLRSG
jgi:hypothetical protein